MKIKTRNVIILIIIFLSVVSFFYHDYILNQELTEKHALILLFNNYDVVNKNSIWNKIDPPNNMLNEYFSKKIGIVSRIFFQSYSEDGKKKYFLITKTIPIDIPFECHACLPLLSAAVFYKVKGLWQIEAKNHFLMYEGEYGIPPKMKLISIGPDRFGVKIEASHVNGEYSTKEVSLIVPHKEKVVIAHEEMTYYDNFNSCGHSIQCANFSTSIQFDKSKNNLFYEMKIKKHGTENDEDQYYKAVPVDEQTIYQLKEGKYIKTI